MKYVLLVFLLISCGKKNSPIDPTKPVITDPIVVVDEFDGPIDCTYIPANVHLVYNLSNNNGITEFSRGNLTTITAIGIIDSVILQGDIIVISYTQEYDPRHSVPRPISDVDVRFTYNKVLKTLKYERFEENTEYLLENCFKN